MVPKKDYNGLLTWMNEYLTVGLRNVVPGFVHAENGKAFQERYVRLARDIKNVKPVSADGSGFDSTQWAGLIDSVDNELYKRIWPSLCDYFNFHEDMRRPLLDFVLNTKSKVKLLHKMGGRKPRTVLTFDLKGTTPSGHPIRTTVGNTLRTLMYYAFMASEAGLIENLPLLPLRKKTQSELEKSQGDFPLE